AGVLRAVVAAVGGRGDGWGVVAVVALIAAALEGVVEVEVVDSTGAGDAFAAKYLAQRLAGFDVSDSLKDANAFAAQAVTQPGGQP
ncbi:MAG: sugar kinase, partial [Actinobacteria bacterium]|nr:sugar kinase [Actinomycetota bacterium]